jgi:hypothetical protein
MKRKKYYKVVVLVTEMIPVVRKQVFVNVEKCVEDNYGTLRLIKKDSTVIFPIESMKFEYFKKPQKRWIDDGTDIHKSRTKKKDKVA